MRLRATLVAVGLLALLLAATACNPQPLPQAPTPIPTLAPATLPAMEVITLGPVADHPTAVTSSPGQTLFAMNCAACHNLSAQQKVGPGLAGLFAKSALPNGQPPTDEALRQWIVVGGGTMPGVPLKTEDLEVLIRYLKSATGSALPASASSPIARGEGLVGGKPTAEFFLDSCGGCHGTDRRGATGPALLPQRLTQEHAYYFDVIKNGKPGTIMPPWGSTVSDEEIETLIAFIYSQPSQAALQWTQDDVEASLSVLIDEGQLPAKPTHSGNLDNLMLVTERESQAIAVIDGDTHQLLGKIPASYRAHGYTFSPVEPRWAYNMGR
ncbi:MAG: c-type cytochrome, partial [Chloroflexi bacterium]|nr:c-type cytochrome [Chloroflexota bacterium]